MTVTILSAAFGAYDQPAIPPRQDIDVRWVMVTDGQVDVPAPWEHVIEPRPELHPRLAAKQPKCLPWWYADSDVIIWLDASAEIYRTDFARMCVQALGDADVAQWVHPQRDCIVPEAQVSATMAKYAGLPVHAQVDHYLRDGHPEHYGLWATGCTVWSAGQADAGATWLAEQHRWTYQDQLSWPVVVRRHGLTVAPLPGGLWDRTWVGFRAHASDQ